MGVSVTDFPKSVFLSRIFLNFKYNHTFEDSYIRIYNISNFNDNRIMKPYKKIGTKYHVHGIT